ncbi:MAG: hypothetical protein A2X94_10300 [Bdellovibrionales bacterium GWB1_55_8]|nr:MAG: hypothetical protein A2X94_10300 [Bdellovibrionales bacterium GWB1_55_8]
MKQNKTRIGKWFVMSLLLLSFSAQAEEFIGDTLVCESEYEILNTTITNVPGPGLSEEIRLSADGKGNAGRPLKKTEYGPGYFPYYSGNGQLSITVVTEDLQRVSAYGVLSYQNEVRLQFSMTPDKNKREIVILQIRCVLQKTGGAQ